MDFASLLPQDPWLGPPLPKFLNIYWPWVGGTATQPQSFLKAPPREVTSDLVTYDNVEEIEFPEGFDPDTLMPRKIRVHRKAKVVR